MRAVAVCVVAFASACGDNVPPGAADGSRLALRRFAYEDGSVQVDRGRYQDLARDEPCTPQRWSDGERYCTPAFVETAYADSQCLTLVGHVPAGAVASYAVGRGVDGLISTIYEVAGPYASTSTFVWRLQDGRCQGPFSDPEPSTLVELRSAETREAFARVGRTAAGRGDRLQVIYDTSDDGFRAPIGFHDQTLGFECRPDAAPDAATAACVPTFTTSAAYFADAACTVLAAPAETVRTPDAIVDARAGACIAHYSVDRAVERLWTFGACAEIELPQGPRYLAAGRRLDLAHLPRTPAGETRIRPRLLAAEEPELTDALVFDSMFGVDCAPTPASDGLRCLPAGTTDAAMVQRSTTPDCRNPITVVYLAAQPCASAPTFVVGSDGLYRRLGDEYTLPLYTQGSPGSCTGADVPAGTVVRVVGPPVPETGFAAVQVTP